jgi:hypothetical protein
MELFPCAYIWQIYSIVPVKQTIPNLRTTYFPLSIHCLASSEKRLFMTVQKLFMTGFRVATLGETGVWLDAVVSGSVKHPTTSEFLFPLR